MHSTKSQSTTETIVKMLRCNFPSRYACEALLTSIRSTVASSPSLASPDFVLPPLSLHNLAQASKRHGDRSSGGHNQNWSSESPKIGTPNGGGQWDRTSAAQQLVGLSKDAPARSGLQHERPVALQPPPKMGPPPAAQPIYDALDLDDLQNYLSWDMYGIMEISDTVSNVGTEVTGLQSWSG